MDESLKQGDEEKSRSIPVNALGDRNQVSIEKCQVKDRVLLSVELLNIFKCQLISNYIISAHFEGDIHRPDCLPTL